jgi:hypothetical protein
MMAWRILAENHSLTTTIAILSQSTSQTNGCPKNAGRCPKDASRKKTKLVTFVTDNVLLLGIVGNKNLLARMLQDKER